MYSLGIDIGSVSVDFVVIDEKGQIVHQLYLKTMGNPVAVIREGMEALSVRYTGDQIWSAGVTGSGRHLASAIVGADVVKNEITTHAVAAAAIDPDIRTIIEIGGQDSKMILLEDGLVKDFAMNTVCAAGTGAFLDRQAERLGLSIDEIGPFALRGKNPVRIAGRCAVFAESDLIHKQQLGYSMEDIVAGMCKALVRNYLANVAKGKQILPVICFQGGVAANQGIKAAFEKELGVNIFVPKHHMVMGAYGSALLAREEISKRKGVKTKFKGFEPSNYNVASSAFECHDCSNNCEVIQLTAAGKQIGCFADRCGKYQNIVST